MKLLFVVNPISGGVDKEPFLKEAKELCEKYAINYEVFKTTGKNDEEELQKVLKSFDPDKIASVGGDGTTLFTSIALLNTKYPMGIIPLGSANGMAAELYVNPKPIEAFKDLLMSEVIGEMDMLVVNDEFYTIHIGDVGVNANIVDAYDKDPNRGMVTYAKYFLEELRKLEPFEMTVETETGIRSAKGVMIAICNSRKYGTGIPLNVVGNPFDGKFELVLIEKIDLPSLIKSGLSKFDEAFANNQEGTVLTTDAATIKFKSPRLLQLDGEVIGNYDEISIKVLKGAVKLISHNQNLYLI